MLSLDQMESQVISKVEEEVPLFSTYLREKLLPAIEKHIVEPRWTVGSIPLNWKNNCCEAINPDMIDKIQRIVNLQFADVRRALHGQGNFQLVPQCQHFQISHTSWVSKTKTEKDKAYENFMTSRKRKRADFVSSTDGKLTIPKTPKLAKKPCQRIRPNQKLQKQLL